MNKAGRETAPYPSKGDWILACLILAIAASAFSVFTAPRLPIGDEYFYLRHALALTLHGSFGQLLSNGQIAAPLAAPGFPSLLWAAMELDPALTERALCWISADATKGSCAPGFGVAGTFSAILMGAVTGQVYLAGLLATRSRWIAVLAVIVWLASGEPQRFSQALLTEALALPLLGGCALALVLALRHKSLRWLAGAATFYGAAALVRPGYGYALLLLAPALACVWAWRVEPGAWLRSIRAALTFASVVGGLTLSWNALDRSPSPPQGGYGAYALAYRMAYNAMTPTEYVAGWLYWIPDFGDNWARALLGEESIRRFDYGAKDGFYIGEVQTIIAQVRETTGIQLGLYNSGEQTANAPSPLRYLIQEYVLADLERYVPVTALLTWRGAFPGKLVGLIGLCAFIWSLRTAGGTYRTAMIALALPALSLLAFQAAISLNIPRYNLALLLPYTVASGLLLRTLFTSALHRIKRLAPREMT